MPGFMSKDEERFLGSQLLNHVVINHDALRCAESDDISIDLICFAAGVHQKHSITRNLQTCTFCKCLEVAGELRMPGGERFELVKQGIDNDGLEQKNDEHDGQGSEPKVKPPPAGTLANYDEQDQSH